MIFISVEVKLRELTSRLMICADIINRGSSAVIGAKNAIENMPSNGDVVLMKGGATNERLDFFHRKGVITSILPEEITPYLPKMHTHIPSQFEPAAEPFVNRYYAVSPEISSIARTTIFKSNPSKVLETGWPRYESWHRPSLWSAPMKKIKQNYGAFDFFSSDFGFIRPERVSGIINELQNWSGNQNSDYIEFYRKRAHFSFKAFGNFVDYINQKYIQTERKLVVRPHPSEDVTVWKNAITNPNVIVQRRGDITPWIMACDNFFHRGCTTAVQAALMGKKPHFLSDLAFEKETTAAQCSINSQLKNLSSPNIESPSLDNVQLSKKLSLHRGSSRISEDLIQLDKGKTNKPISQTTVWLNELKYLVRKTNLLAYKNPGTYGEPSTLDRLDGGISYFELRRLLQELTSRDFLLEPIATNVFLVSPK